MRSLKLITHNKESLTPGERKIADYILDHPERLKQSSSQELAKVLGISQSSVIKFAQRLGFKGFTNLKIAFIEEWGQISSQRIKEGARLHNNISSNDNLRTIAEKLFLEKQQALRDSTDGIDISELEKVIGLIQSAKRIQITGVGGSSLVAKDLAYKMMKIGYCVMNELDSHVQVTVAQSLGPDDIQIAISFSGILKEIKVAAEAAKNNGAKVIAITSLQDSPLRKLADHILDTIADETQWRSSSISARTAQNTITDLLFVCLLQQDSDKKRQFIEQSQLMVAQLK